MELFAVILVMVHMAVAEQCGEPPVCKCLSRYLSCMGSNVTAFPNFDEHTKTSISQIEFVNTSLVHVPEVSEWKSLSTVIMEKNWLLSCEEVNKLQVIFPHLTVVSDCKDGCISPMAAYIVMVIQLLVTVPTSVLMIYYAKVKVNQMKSLKKNART